ncbi:MAG TPA: DMT family transporter [Burkholderiaceae bacterium]|nr:DMT family transporter [Burkholderiaceae bacterium]
MTSISAEAEQHSAGERGAHRRAILLMVCAATLWSMAGVVTRNLSPALQAEGRFEITFWRSFFAAVFVAGYLVAFRREGLRPVFAGGAASWISGSAWAVMYVAFMLALTLTTVANTLLVMSVGPLLTALLAWLVLGTRIARRTWLAIAVAMAGMAWMFTHGATAAGSASHLLGMAIAFAVPMASAINLVTLQKTRARLDLVPAVFLGGAISAALMLPLALPFKAAPADVLLLAALGFFQLGLPCMLMVAAARHLAAPEIALLALLEVVLGPLWAWLGAGEVPATATLAGGALVLLALAANEIAALRRRES